MTTIVRGWSQVQKGGEVSVKRTPLPQYENRKEDKVDRRGKEKSLTLHDLRRGERTIVLGIGLEEGAKSLSQI
jgi:hypothetical protein